MAFLRTGQAAALVGCSPSALRLWEERGLLRTRRTPGGHRRYEIEDVLRLMKAPK